MKQNNTGLIVKSRMEVPFAQIPNKVLRDPSLSLKAKGLLSILLSLPSDWSIYKTQLPSFSKDGRDATTGAFDELVDAGYIVVIRRHNSKGQFAGNDYVVYSEPATPITENPLSDKPISDNPSLQIQNLQTKNIQTQNTTNILGKTLLKSKICMELNISTKQFNLLMNDELQYWNQDILDANKELIKQYKNEYSTRP
jgi:hypothetical protein